MLTRTTCSGMASSTCSAAVSADGCRRFVAARVLPAMSRSRRRRQNPRVTGGFVFRDPSGI